MGKAVNQHGGSSMVIAVPAINFIDLLIWGFSMQCWC
jgi:hypothetical protein